MSINVDLPPSPLAAQRPPAADSRMNRAPHATRFPVMREPLALAEDALADTSSREVIPRASWYDGDEHQGGDMQLTAGVAVIDVCGVIDSRASWYWTGYDEVLALVERALMSPKVTAIVLAIDSPGGVAAGMVDTGRALRMAADRWGKPMVAHAGPMACSAAYGLAASCDKIITTADGTVGSVGVLAIVYDRTKQNEAEGLNVAVLKSGALKADGHPDVPLTAAATSRMLARVNQLATMFAGWVGERRGMTADEVLLLQGGVAYGADAVTKRLADGVGTLADAVATAATMAAAKTTTAGKPTMNTTAAQALETLARLRADLGVTDDAELIAAVSTSRQRAGQLDAVTTERDALRAQLAERDQRAVTAARAAVVDKHTKRGALTPAMLADSAYMADLAPLSPEALDRVLSKLEGLNTAPVQPLRKVDAATGAIEGLTAEEIEWAETTGITPAAMLATKAADAKKAAKRGTAQG